jgi:transposase
MGRALDIRDDLSASEQRARATLEKKNRVARRMLAIANALDGMSRAEAARAAGMDRQALRDAVVRYNAEGIDGLYDRPTPGRPQALTAAELALLSARILDGPDPETDGVSSWTLPDLCRWIEARYDKLLPPQSLSRILRREGFSRQKTRPTHPKADEAARESFEKGGSRRHWRLSRRPIPASG